jgi:hypothetical protein
MLTKKFQQQGRIHKILRRVSKAGSWVQNSAYGIHSGFNLG